MADSLETETIYLAIENLLTNVSKLQDLAQLACASVDARAIRECDRFRYVGLHQVRLGCHISPVPIKDAEKQFIEAFMQTVLGLSETVMACVRHAQTADPSGPQPPIDSMLYDWTTGANEDVCAASKRLKEVADGARGPNISLFARKEKDPAKPERSADKGTIEEETMEDVEILDDGEISDDSWSVISDPVTTAEEDFEQLEIVKALVPDIAEEIEKSERERKEQEAEEKMAKMELDVQTETIPDLINKLRDRSALLAEFLPILKADINEYLSTAMHPTEFAFPPSPPPDPFPSSSRFSPAPRYAPNSLQSLRASLYNLRDELIRNTSLLSRLLFTTRADTLAASPNVQGSILAPPTALEITALRDAQTVASSALTRAISNNGSEWIESALNGGLSFAEFKNLEQDEIDGFVEGLRTLSSEMEVFIGRVRSIRSGQAGVFNDLKGYEKPKFEEGETTEEGFVVNGKGLDITELRWWRERVEGLNWSLKARKEEKTAQSKESGRQNKLC